MLDFEQLAAQAIAAAGLGTVVMLIVQLGKTFNLVPDGKAGWFASVLNVLGMIGLMVAKVGFNIDLEGEQATAIMSMLATIAEALLAILTSIGAYHAVQKAQLVKS